MKRINVFLLTLMLLLGLSVPGQATLVNMGDGTIYDTDLHLSWLQNANTNGLMTWSAANTWADNLSFAGFDNWRLPTTLQPDSSCATQNSGVSYGYNCIRSEMGHLYHTELGNPAFGPLANMDDFTNLQPNYWSGTQYTCPGDPCASVFTFDVGNQNLGYESQGASFYALAVRPGQRSASVPEPATLLLIGSGLAGIVVWRKRLG